MKMESSTKSFKFQFQTISHSEIQQYHKHILHGQWDDESFTKLIEWIYRELKIRGEHQFYPDIYIQVKKYFLQHQKHDNFSI